MSGHDVELRVWGARGSVACPGPDTVRYGGNTPCIEVRMGDRLVILDGGTGVRPLGARLKAERASGAEPVEADVLLSHYHLDHVSGLPFFSAAFDPENTLRFWGARLDTPVSLRQILTKMMSPPLFPVPIDVFSADTSYHEFDCGDGFTLGGAVDVKTQALNHPGGACGYRLTDGRSVVAYVTDTEHEPGTDSAAALALMENADIAVYDAMYTDEEFETHRGWGHSTWREAVRLADLAGVKTLILFHHDPIHDDAAMDQIAVDAASARPGTLVAREGLTLRL